MHFKILILFIALACIDSYSRNCRIFENDPSCLRDTTDNYPVYSDGKQKEVGDWESSKESPDLYEEQDVVSKQGVVFSYQKSMKRIRKIEAINLIDVEHRKKKKSYISTDCCKEIACMQIDNNHNVTYDCEKKAIYKEMYRDCLIGKSTFSNKCTIYKDSVWYTQKYETVYEDSIYKIVDNDKPPKYVLKQSENALVTKDTLELYRMDGTLRYKGIVVINGEYVATKGDCYNKTGTKSVRRVNNADLCK